MSDLFVYDIEIVKHNGVRLSYSSLLEEDIYEYINLLIAKDGMRSIHILKRLISS